MTNDIRIISIELENYRQYYGEHKIKFSSSDEGFTVITGKNGEGKSNLLNSISWCFYHKEPHGRKDTQVSGQNESLPVINNRYIIEIDKEKIATTSVKIQLSVGDTVYNISRILQVIKHRLEFIDLVQGGKSIRITEHTIDKVPIGCEIINENKNDFVIMKREKDQRDFHDTKSDADPNVIMEEILPERLSKYFLLDGEFVEGIWKDLNLVQDGVEQISQLHLLSSLKTHVNAMRIPSKGAGKDTDELTAKIERLYRYEKSLDDDGKPDLSDTIRWKVNLNEPDVKFHVSGKPRIKELAADIKKMQDRIREISNKIPNISIPSLEMLKNRYEEIEKQIDEEKENLSSHGKKYRYNLITKSPYVFLKNAIEASIKIIEERISLGELPVRHRKQFADDLLKRGTCVCGENLRTNPNDNNTINKRIQNIREFRDSLAGKKDLDAALDMRNNFKHNFVDDYNGFLKSNFGDLRTKFTNSESKYESLLKTWKGVKTQLKSTGNKEIKSLIDEQTYLQELIQSNNEEITNIQLELSANTKTQTNLRIQLEKGLKKNKKARRLSHELDVWARIYSHLETIHNELTEDIRLGVEQNTWKNFQELLSNPEEFKAFHIEPDYTVYLQDAHDMNKIRDLAAGQSLILTLAFVVALREPTGYKFPIVIDSPLGKIDSSNKYNIGVHLPKYLKKEQLVLLVTDTEYTAYLPPDPGYPKLPNTPVGVLLQERIPLKHFRIQKEKQGKNTGNSAINDAELTYDKERKGWMVKTIV